MDDFEDALNSFILVSQLPRAFITPFPSMKALIRKTNQNGLSADRVFGA